MSAVRSPTRLGDHAGGGRGDRRGRAEPDPRRRATRTIRRRRHLADGQLHLRRRRQPLRRSDGWPSRSSSTRRRPRRRDDWRRAVHRTTGSAITPAAGAVTGAGGLSLTPVGELHERPSNAGTCYVAGHTTPATPTTEAAATAWPLRSSSTRRRPRRRDDRRRSVHLYRLGEHAGGGRGDRRGRPEHWHPVGELHGQPDNAGTCPASYTYAGDANHSGSSDGMAFAIASQGDVHDDDHRRRAVHLRPARRTRRRSGTVTGAGGLSTGATTVSYTGDQINAGTYFVTASIYAGDANH